MSLTALSGWFAPSLRAQMLAEEDLAALRAGPKSDRHATAAGEEPQSALTPSAAAAPPLPFYKPMVGPLIKRAPADDVDERTTAFIPQGERFHPEILIEPSEDKRMPDEERWILVDLSDQMVIAYENDVPVRAFVISSGLPRTPTVLGEFRIRTKVLSQTMTGGDAELGTYYSLPNVQWVQYFYEDYSFHGTYWHNDFGRPKSHGCINMTNADAKWLFDWAGPTWDGETVWQKANEANPGTLVFVQE